MKKIMTLFATTTLLTSLALAYIEENKTADVDILRAQGYSESTLRVVDTANAQNKGYKSNYKRRFVKTKKPSAYTNVKLYIDPIQDDDNFGEHQVNFTNTWNGDETHYTTRKVDRTPAENL
ncbi:MAG: hypothetical protein IKU37_00690 [Candidatus Gastranaerophilales bacterium]|nr:hypothetical protein [Candidatus Gastranaerophilales bacterium]